MFWYDSELQPVYEEDERIAEYNVTKSEVRLDFGIQLRRYAEWRFGPVWGKSKGTVDTGATDLPELDVDYTGWRTGLILDQQDRTVFAREGYYLNLDGFFSREGWGGETDFNKLSGMLRNYNSIGDHTFSIWLQGGSGLGDELPGYAQFMLGGPFHFAGLAEGQFRGSVLGVVSLGYAYRLLQLPAQFGKGIYAMTRWDTGNVWTESFDGNDLRYGLAVGLGADTVLGPLYVGYGAADEGYERFYISMGTLF